MLIPRRPLVTASIVAGLGLAAAGPALACSPPLPGVDRTAPAAGETWPANAPLQIWGREVGAENLTVTVDGAPASLVPGPWVSSATLSLRVSPPPAPGATVRVEGDPCPHAPGECEPLDLAFTAGAPDEAPPAAPLEMFQDLWDHGDIDPMVGLCAYGGRYTVYVHLTLPPDAEGGWLFLSGGTRPETTRESWWRVRPGEVVVPLVHHEALDDVEGRCYTARLYDAAGNASASVERCGVCRARSGGAAPDFLPGPEPAWTDADLVDASACGAGVALPPDGGPPDAGLPDAGGAGGDREERAASSGGCAVAPAGTPGAAWLVVLAGSALRRRRR